MKLLLPLLLVLLASPLFALTLGGTGDSGILLKQLAADYHQLYPQRSVEIPASVGSSGGIRLLLRGEVEMARVARPLRGAELGHNLVWCQFALAPIMFVANLPTPCVSDLTKSQIVDIFSGRIDRWSMLGNCPDEKIYLARREADDSFNRILSREIPQLAELKKPAGKILYTTGEALKTLERYPFTLGYLPLSSLVNTQLVRFSLDGIAPNNQNYSAQRYPLMTPFALVWKDPLSLAARDFIAYLNSRRAQEIMRTKGVLPMHLDNL